MSRAADAAAAETLRILEVTADQIRSTAAAGRPLVPAPTPALKQRGRTGSVFNPSKHQRGSHGRFAFEGGSGAHRSPPPKTPAQIKQFQKEYGLPQTGKIDQATAATIAHPPPQSLGQMAHSEAAQKAKAEAAKRQESRAKTNAKRKEEGKPPLGTKGSTKGTGTSSGRSSSRSSGSSSGGSSGSRSALIAAQKVAHDSGNQKLAEALRQQINQTPGSSTGGSGGSRSSSRSSAAASAAKSARETASAKQSINKSLSGISWTGKLNISENLTPGRGMGSGEPPSPAVGLAQAKLQALGFGLGSTGVDGKYGPATATAVRVLQREYGLQPNGVIDAATIQLMESLTERQQKWAKRGIVEGGAIPGESITTLTRRVLAASTAG